MRHSLLLLLMLFAPLLQSNELAPQLQNDQIRVRSWLAGEAPYTVRAMLPLHIEVASRQRFAKGSRVLRLEIPGAIVMQRERFAVNSTRWENGEQWAVQVWTVALYPQRAGQLYVPAQSLSVSVTQSDGTALAGTVSAPALQALVKWPDGLGADDEWIASPAVTLSQQFDRELSGLKRGDVLRRVIDIEAEDVAAMMLPGISDQAQPGLAIYPKPPQLSDSSNRGIYRAKRREVMSYVLEREGQYDFPAQRIRWWDSINGGVQEALLPAFSVSAASGVSPKTGASGISLATVLLLLAGMLLLLAVVYGWRRWQQQAGRVALRRLQQACREGETAKALALFYRCLDLEAPPGYQASIRQWLNADSDEKAVLFERVMSAYAREPRPDVAALLQILAKLHPVVPHRSSSLPDVMRLN